MIGNTCAKWAEEALTGGDSTGGDGGWGGGG